MQGYIGHIHDTAGQKEYILSMPNVYIMKKNGSTQVKIPSYKLLQFTDISRATLAAQAPI